MTYYKVLNADGSAHHGGKGKWFLPSGKRPGKWMPAITGDLVPCDNGYHLCKREHLVRWLGPTIHEAEYRGEIVEADDKVVVREARLLKRLDRWDARTQRLFAADCAAHIIHIYEKQVPDDRPRRAIEVARRYAVGEASEEELVVAWDAARDATWAARGAAWDPAAAAAAIAAGAAAWAAGADTWNAAENAAWAAATSTAAWDAERAWQAERLFFYLEGGAS